MNRPCQCDRARAGDYTPDQCFACWKWANSPEWRDHWENRPRSRSRFSLECSLRGELTGESRPCKTCGNRTRDVPLYACQVHGVCSKDGAPLDGVKWCRTCTEKVPPSPS